MEIVGNEGERGNFQSCCGFEGGAYNTPIAPIVVERKQSSTCSIFAVARFSIIPIDQVLMLLILFASFGPIGSIQLHDKLNLDGVCYIVLNRSARERTALIRLTHARTDRL